MKTWKRFALGAVFLGAIGTYLVKNYDFSYHNHAVHATARQGSTVVSHDFKKQHTEIRAARGDLEGRIGYDHKNNKANGAMHWKDYVFAAIFEPKYKTFTASFDYTPRA